MADVTGSLTTKAEPSPDRRSAARRRSLWRALSRQSQGCRCGAGLWPGAARQRPARAGRRRARAGQHRQSRQQAAARGLGPRARRQRQFPAGLRRAVAAHTPDNPDWRILSVQGTVLDQLGRHEEARGYYASALKIVPGEPSVLSNLGMSYVLTASLPKAEETLRQAYANPKADSRVRQNLGLVVGLQGRFAEAETIVKADLPPDEAAANVAYLKDMLRKDSARRTQRRPGGAAQPAGIIRLHQGSSGRRAAARCRLTASRRS